MSQCAPLTEDLADVYNKLANETDEIISIPVTSKESGIYNSALMGKGLVKKKCRIELLDSQLVAMPCAILLIAAANEAQSGADG